MFLTLSLVVGLVLVLYFYLTWNFEYWKTRSVLSPEPKLLFGNFSDSSKRKCHVIDDLTKIYNDYKHRANFIGIYQFRSPRVLVLEPELGKEILIKNFKNFKNNEFSNGFDEKQDPLFARNPFFARDEMWKERRTEIAPAMTSNRMKVMYPQIERVCQRFSTYIKEILSQPIEAKHLATKFTSEVVANCVFGIEANSFNSKDSKLCEMSKKLFQFSTFAFIKLMIAQAVPSLKEMLKIKFISQEVNDYFMDLIDQATNYRMESQSSRGDYLDFVVELQKKKGLSSRDLAGHSMTFFSDGLESSSIAIAHILYELANNPQAQEKLRKEINEFSAKSEGITFEALNEMPYLDQVFNEGLRLHPPFHALIRECNEDTQVEYLKNKSVLIEKGMVIDIPTYQFQHDPEYFPRPSEFIPERFDAEHGGVKAFKDKGVLLSFGDGPRICLGMKFALMQSKSAIVEIIKNFKISVNGKTAKPLEIDPAEFLNVKKGGLWLDFKPVKMFEL